MAKISALRKIITAVAAICVVSTASFIGCDSLSGGESSSGSTNSDYSSNSGSGSSSGDSSDGSSDSTSSGSGDTSTADTSYSSIFSTIITSSSYLYTNEQKNTYGSVSGNSYSSTSQKYQEIPYGFDDADFNSQKIYNDELECVSIPYFINGNNNTLYLSVRAEHDDDSTTSYYTCYILKYTITDKEYSELTQIFSGNTLLMPFYIQELSKQKTATIVNKVKIKVTAYEYMLKYLKNNSELSTDVFGSTNIELDFMYFTPQETDHDEQYMIINVRSDSAPKKVSSSKASFINDGEIRTITLSPSTLSSVRTYNDEGVIYSSWNVNFIYTADDYQNDENATQITYYYSRSGVNLKSYTPSDYLSE
ncbi:MAG: hypothetical protein LUI60_01710 [Clostridia bacterium]|nr:hypothetical protein [Clostridia bacterium]